MAELRLAIKPLRVHGTSIGDVCEIDLSNACVEVDSNMSLVLCACVQTGRATLVHAIFGSYLSDWKEKYKVILHA